MATIHPHINFNGNAQEAFEFYRSIFGGDFKKIIRFRDLASADFKVPETEMNKIMHIALTIGNNLLMANDVPSMMGQVNENENRSKIVVSADSQKEADRIFTGLSEGGTVEMPIGDSPWDTYFGMSRDKFGIEWMIEFDPKGKSNSK